MWDVRFLPIFPVATPSSPCARALHPTGLPRSNPPGAPGALPVKGSRQTHGHRDHRSTGMASRACACLGAVTTGGLGTPGGRAPGHGSALLCSDAPPPTAPSRPQRCFWPFHWRERHFRRKLRYAVSSLKITASSSLTLTPRCGDKDTRDNPVAHQLPSSGGCPQLRPALLGPAAPPGTEVLRGRRPGFDR